MECLKTFIKSVSAFSKDYFLTQHTEPYFVTAIKVLNKNALQPEDKSTNHPPKMRFTTKPTTSSELNMFEKEIQWAERGWIAPVVSKKGSASMQIINIGRTNNNDIVIPVHSISKLHALVMLYGDNEFSLVDGESKNGTFVNGKQIQPNEKTLLESGNLVKFGKVIEFEFYFPDDLFERLPVFSEVMGL